MSDTLAAAQAAHRRQVISYFDETYLDYRVLWMNSTTLSMHLGYWDDRTRTHAESMLNMNRVLADRAGIQSGQAVLDAGCGIGGSGFWLARQRDAEVVGITLSARQVERARRLSRAQGLADRVTFEQADYTSTPFPDASFDVVWSLDSLCHAVDKGAFYREARRLLRPGGRLVVSEWFRAARPLDGTNERLMREWLDGWAMPDLDTAAEHVGYATAAKLTAVQLDDVTGFVRPSLRHLYRLGRWLYPLGVVLRRLGLRSATQHGNLVGALRQYETLERGCWFYGHLSATQP